MKVLHQMVSRSAHDFYYVTFATFSFFNCNVFSLFCVTLYFTVFHRTMFIKVNTITILATSKLKNFDNMNKYA